MAKFNKVDYEEFLEDYQRYWYIVKLLVIYRNSGELNVRLLFNHLIILSNNFGKESAEILLKIVLEKADYDVLSYTMTLLDYIGYMPENKVMSIMGEEYILSDIKYSEEFLKYVESKLDEAHNV